MKTKKALLIILLTFVVIYLSFAFVKMEINPENWSEYSRFGYIFISTLLSIWINIIIHEAKKADNV